MDAEAGHWATVSSCSSVPTISVISHSNRIGTRPCCRYPVCGGDRQSSQGHRIHAIHDLRWGMPLNRVAAYGQAKLANGVHLRAVTPAGRATHHRRRRSPWRLQHRADCNLPRLIHPSLPKSWAVAFQSPEMGACHRVCRHRSDHAGRAHMARTGSASACHPKVVQSSAVPRQRPAAPPSDRSEELTGVSLKRPIMHGCGQSRSINVVVEMMRAWSPDYEVPLTQAQGLPWAATWSHCCRCRFSTTPAMDGYAVRAEDTSGATPQKSAMLPVAEDIRRARRHVDAAACTAH